MAERVLTLKLIGDASSLQRALRSGSTSAKRFDSDITKAGRGALAGSGVFKGLGRSIAFASSAFLGGAGLAAATRSAFDEMISAQKASAQTAAVLKSTGGAAGVTAKQVDRLAQTLLNLSGVDDEAIKGAENVLLTFRNIRNEQGKNNDIFTQAAKTTLDLSVALKEDLQSAAIQVGKALNDPVRGLTALQRIGVTFSAQQKTLIKNLVATGDTLGAQKVILEELRKEFGGSAAAAGKTFGGQLEKLHQTVLNLEGSIAKTLEPSIERIVKRFQKWLDNSRNQKAVLDDVKQAANALGSVVHALQTGMAALNAVTGSTKNSLKLLLAGLVAFKTLKLASTFAEIAGNVGLIGTKAEGAKGKVALLRTALLNLKTLGVITVGVELAIHGKQLDDATKEFLDKIGLGFLGNAATFDLRDLVNDIRGKKGATAPPGFLASATLQSVIAASGGFFHQVQQPRRGTAGLGLPNAVTGSIQTVAPHLTAAQQRAISLAGSPSLEALRAQADFDKRSLAALQKRFEQGKIGARQYVKVVTNLKNDLAQQESAIASILQAQNQKIADRANARAKAAKAAAEKAKKALEAVAENVSVFLENATRGVTLGLSKTRQNEIAKQVAKTAIPERITGEGPGFATSFQAPLLLQLEEAKAAAQGKSLKPVLERMRAAAKKALASGVLAVQGQIDAWNAIADINDQLKGKAKTDQTKFRHVATGSLLQGLGLTGDQLRAARARLAQVGPGGTIPQRQAAFALSGGTGGITIHGGLHLHGVQNLRQLEDQLEKRAKSRPQKRRG